MAKTIELNFDGYYPETALPPSGHDCKGVYSVYAGQRASEGHCKLRKLLYIGRSHDIATRPSSSHHKYDDWHEQLRKGELLYFSFADTDSEELAEAALIYELQPVGNDIGKESFRYPETTIKALGAKGRMPSSFTV